MGCAANSSSVPWFCNDEQELLTHTNNPRHSAAGAPLHHETVPPKLSTQPPAQISDATGTFRNISSCTALPLPRTSHLSSEHFINDDCFQLHSTADGTEILPSSFYRWEKEN